MFKVLHEDLYIGDTSLAKGGDPPMGCAEGDFRPCEAFDTFRATVPPKEQDIPGYLIWSGLNLLMDDGRFVECVDIVLHVFGFENGDKEMVIDALGISDPPYETLFPQHVEAYENQFKDG